VDFKTVCRLRLGTKKLIVPRPVYNVDRSPNLHGTITQTCKLRIKQGNKEAKQLFYVTNLGKDRFILGYPWFCTFNPDIDWVKAQLQGPKVSIETTHLATAERVKNWLDKKHQTSSMAKVECEPWSGVTASEMKCGWVEIKCTTAAETFQQKLGIRLQRYKEEIKRTHTAADMAHKYVEEHGTTNVVLLEEFKRHTALFSEEEANQFPPSRGEADHKIVLLETTHAKFNCKVYPISQKEREIEDKFLDEKLGKRIYRTIGLSLWLLYLYGPKEGLKGNEIYHRLPPP